MTEVIIIAAVAKNNCIGSNGKIPWHIKEDFRYFKEQTLHHACIMGRSTYESLPARPLPERENIVITRNKDYFAEGAKVVQSLDNALSLCTGDKAFIIGGASVYKEGMAVADTLMITHIERDFPGDTFFPDIGNEWILVSERKMKDEKYGDYSFRKYKRRD